MRSAAGNFDERSAADQSGPPGRARGSRLGFRGVGSEADPPRQALLTARSDCKFVRLLSRELGDRDIRVNAISPGFTDTDLQPERDRAVAAEMSPFKRANAPEDITDVGIFLAARRARLIAGQSIAAAGGVL